MQTSQIKDRVKTRSSHLDLLYILHKYINNKTYRTHLGNNNICQSHVPVTHVVDHVYMFVSCPCRHTFNQVNIQISRRQLKGENRQITSEGLSNSVRNIRWVYEHTVSIYLFVHATDRSYWQPFYFIFITCVSQMKLNTGLNSQTYTDKTKINKWKGNAQPE